MTEEQAIERITAALRRQAHGIDAITGRDMAPAIARTAWNEIKAIARENLSEHQTLPRWFTELTTEEAIEELCRNHPAAAPQKRLGPGL